MTSSEAINKLIRDTVNLLLSSPGYTIKAKQKDAPRPIGPYADVDVMLDTKVGWEEHSLKDNTSNPDITDTIRGYRKIMISVNFYRTNAYDNARKVSIGLVRESIQSLFKSAGVGLLTRSDVRQIDEPLSNGWEERSQFDIVLSTVSSDTDIVRSIQVLNIEGEYQARGLVYNFNTEVQ